MARAGMTHVCSLITFSYPSDDSSGGAVPSGTVLYQRLDARIEQNMPTIQLLEQGLQVPETFQVLVHPGNIDAKHNDQILVTAPQNDWFYNKKFRIIGLTRSSSHFGNDRALIKFIVRRWDESHQNDLQ
jgi:hypothetical protein